MVGTRRALAIAAGASFLLAGLVPCPRLLDDGAGQRGTGLERAAAHASHTSHAVASSHGTEHSGAEAPADDPGASLSAPCPCGCAGDPGAGASSGPSLSKLLLSARLDAPIPGKARLWPEPTPALARTPARAVDHVPILG